MNDNKHNLFTEIRELNQAAWDNKYDNSNLGIDNAKRALQLSERIDYQEGIASSKINLSVINFLTSTNTQDVLSNLIEAIDYFKIESPSKFYVRALYFTGNIYESYGDFDIALSYCQKALKFAKLIEYSEGIADTKSIIGIIYSRLGEYENSIIQYKGALKIREELGNKKATASSLNLIARANVLRNNYVEALSFYKQALELREKINDTSGLPWTYIGIASLYEQIKDNNKAIDAYNKSIALNTQPEDKRCKMHCFMGLGRIRTKLKEYSEAEIDLTNSLEIANQLKTKPVLYEIHLAMSELYEKMTRTDFALKHFKLFQQNKEEVLNDELRNKLKNQHITFAIEKSKKEAEIYQLKHVELKNAYDELSKKNNEITKKNLEITDSINYAKRIQYALLPSGDYIKKILPERFILFKPKDIVSGDFYWLSKVDNKIIIVAADCTGHGVPGAFMSMLGVSFLNEIVTKNKTTEPAEILNCLRAMVIDSLDQNQGESKDGMDIALAVLDTENTLLKFAGAYNSLYLIKANQEQPEIMQIKADRMPIGIHFEIEKQFTTKEIQLCKNDIFYLFSDGYQDQFGGKKNKKFKSKRFRKLLLEIYQKPLEEQQQILDKIIEKWRGDINQIDDIIVVGVRV